MSCLVAAYFGNCIGGALQPVLIRAICLIRAIMLRTHSTLHLYQLPFVLKIDHEQLFLVGVMFYISQSPAPDLNE